MDVHKKFSYIYKEGGMKRLLRAIKGEIAINEVASLFIWLVGLPDIYKKTENNYLSKKRKRKLKTTPG